MKWQAWGSLWLLMAVIALPSSLRADAKNVGGQTAEGGRIEAQPKALEDVGIDEHLGSQLPIDVLVTEADGKQVQLHEVLTGSRPAILTLNYSDCPMLCNLQLDGLAAGLREVGLTPGRDYDIVTLSINPHEELHRTRAFRDRYLKAIDRPEDLKAWRFFTAEQDVIDKIARTVGFRYTWVPSQKEYAHTAAFVLLAPDTRILRYVYGVMFEPRDLRLAIVEAAEGRAGGTFDRILLYCFHYDAATGKYAPMAQNIMRLGGAVTTVVLGGTLGLFFLRERRKRLAQRLGNV